MAAHIAVFLERISLSKRALQTAAIALRTAGIAPSCLRVELLTCNRIQSTLVPILLGRKPMDEESPPRLAALAGCKTEHCQGTFHVYLIKPSKYDDDGFVIRHWRGVVPSNSLACLHGLTADVQERGLLGQVEMRTHVIDESVSRIPLDEIARRNRAAGCRALACLVGVQTNQFCRAADITLSLRREGVPVMVGGFHVTGMLALFPGVSPEIRQLLDAGVSVVAGEVEHRWHELLRDAWEGKLQPIYRLIDDPPDLYEAACPCGTGGLRGCCGWTRSQ